MTALLNLAMSDRPQSQRLLKQWLEAMTPDDEDAPGRISVVSFRVLPQLNTRCSLYIRPNGYTQQGRHAVPPGAPRPSADPYRV
jgi:hypothetical protein